jgi:putative oxidoreductase
MKNQKLASDVGLLLLRLAVAAIFLFHGTQKWALWGDAGAQIPAQMVIIMKILSIAEPLGALALILGIFTRWAGLGLSIIMLGAIWFKIAVFKQGFAGVGGTGWEFDLILLAASACLMLTGGGAIALDRMMGKKKDDTSSSVSIS